MKFSEQWLREWVDPDIDIETLAHQLTMAGLEVDGVTPAYPDFDGLIVAELKSVSKHPDADKLHICQVAYGEEETLTIVCGAANVRVGMRTVLAKVGATLPGKQKLEAVSLKGVTSYGMLCSASEIGLGEDSDGIIDLSPDEPIGKSLKDVIDINDNIIEISLTPNRGDCLSIRGIAREVAVINHIDIHDTKNDSVEVTSKASHKIKLSAVKGCPRYVGRVIENVDVSVKSPLWLSEKLRCSGIRSINVVVDITNFVMLELGQPMHAFDNDRIKGDIEVRYPKDKENLKLLDESEYQIKPGTLLISDDYGPLAMAGLMGGLGSAVTTESKNIFLESAFFTPEIIIGEAREYGLHTDSSHRFERGVDPELQTSAIERASGLILQYCGGQAGPVVEKTNKENLPRNDQVILRKAQIKRVLGIDLDEKFVTDTFNRLGMDCKYSENQWIIVPPSHRFDIKIEVDLIEELARIYSYDAISVATTNSHLKMRAPNHKHQSMKHIREILVNRDYQEVITYSFVDPLLHKLLNNKDKTISLANPIAPELSEMRTSLLPGLLNSLQYNIKRQRERIRLFETGLVFIGCEQLKQEYHIGGLIYGNINENQWDKDNILCDFYDIKCDIEAILYSMLEIERVDFKVNNLEMLHPGQAVNILIDGNVKGYFGQLHPQICSNLYLNNNLYVFDMNIENINRKAVVKYQPISRFPSVKRDIAILIDDKIPLAELVSCVKNAATILLTNLELFDVYQGEGIEKGKKSLALGLTFQETSSTLKDEEVETIMGNIIDGLHNKFGAKLRE